MTTENPLCILGAGLVTSVGLDALASCAAIRAKIANPQQSAFMDSEGEWIMAHSVPLPLPVRGREKLLAMATLAITDCLKGVLRQEWPEITLLLCVADGERPGRLAGMDESFIEEIQSKLKVGFSEKSAIIAGGRMAFAVALNHARQLTKSHAATRILVAGTDSMLSAPTLSEYSRRGRLLSPENSDGFLPGEGAAAVLVGPPETSDAFSVIGLGFGTETSTIDSDIPLRGDGLVQAIKAACLDAGVAIDEIDFRMTDHSGEQYYFKEASLALTRVMRVRKSEFHIFHPAECIGETGTVAPFAGAIFAFVGSMKSYLPGRTVLLHAASDCGNRMAVLLRRTRV